MEWLQRKDVLIGAVGEALQRQGKRLRKAGAKGEKRLVKEEYELHIVKCQRN